jgi:hypothetical protein
MARRHLTPPLPGTVHYFSDSSDDAADDDGSEDEPEDKGGNSDGAAVASLMAAVEIGEKALVAAVGEGVTAAASPVACVVPAAPVPHNPQLQQKPAAVALPPACYAPSARMCSSIVMKALTLV